MSADGPATTQPNPGETPSAQSIGARLNALDRSLAEHDAGAAATHLESLAAAAFRIARQLRREDSRVAARRARDLLALPATPDYPEVPDWRDPRTGTTEAWQAFADDYHIFYPPECTRGRLITNVQDWLRTRDGDRSVDGPI